MTRGSIAATAVTIATTAIVEYGENPVNARARVLVESAVLLVGATAGIAWAERRRVPLVVRVVVTGLCALGAIVLCESNANEWQSLMPLLSAVLLFESLHAAVALTLLYSVEILFVRRALPVHRLLETCGWFLAASTFVIAFSQLRLKERAAHAELERLAADIERANRRLSEYATQVEDLAITKERNRLSREIHDTLGHYLTVIHVQIQAAKTHLDRAPALARECLSRAQKLTHEGLTEVRRSVAVLRSAPTEQRSLVEAITSLVDDFRASGLAAEVRIDGAPRTFAGPVEFALYRAVQEALTNVHRHAAASSVVVALHYGDAALALRVTDDGVGTSSMDGGFGLLGLTERIKLVGGTVEIATSVGRGFSIELTVPG